MKANLTYNLPEEQSEHLMAIHGKDFYGSLCDIDNVCRAILKHDVKPKPKDIQHIRDIISNTDGFCSVE